MSQSKVHLAFVRFIAFICRFIYVYVHVQVRLLVCSLIRCFMKNAKESFLFSCFVVGFVTTVTTKSEPRQLFSDGIGSTKSKDGIFIGTWMLFPMTSWCWYLGLQKASNEEVSAALYCHFVPKSYCTVCTIL